MNMYFDPDSRSAMPSVGSFDGEKVPIVNVVTDAMDFCEAFVAAREEVGPGGIFFWRGGIHVTYYQDEWDNLPSDYRLAFTSYFYHENYDEAIPDTDDDVFIDIDDSEIYDTQNFREEYIPYYIDDYIDDYINDASIDAFA